MPFPALIRDVPDFPRAGILFKDIMPMLAGAAVLVELEALGGRARWTLPAPLLATLRY